MGTEGGYSRGVHGVEIISGHLGGRGGGREERESIERLIVNMNNRNAVMTASTLVYL